MRYNLNLTKDYCKHWTVNHAIRELIANTIDEKGTIDLEPNALVANDPVMELVLKTPKELPLEAFLMGYSAKDSINPIGQYGEGLKIAFLILLRENIDFYVQAGVRLFQFKFYTPEGFSIPTLHIETITDINLDYIEGTIMKIAPVTQEQFDSIYTNKPFGILENQKGLYCQGLLVEPKYCIIDTKNNKEYGVNFDESVSMNRDRTYFSAKHKVTKYLEQYCKPEFFLNFNTTASEVDIFRAFSDEYAQKIAKAYLKKNNNWTLKSMEGKRVIFPENYDDTYLKDPNYIIPTGTYWGYGSYLQRDKDAEKLKELRIKANDQYATNVENESYMDKRARVILEDIDKANDANDVIRILMTYMPLRLSARETILEELRERGLMAKEKKTK